MSGTRGCVNGKADTVGNCAMFPPFGCNIFDLFIFVLPFLVPRIKIIMNSST